MRNKTKKYLLRHQLTRSKPTILLIGATGAIGRWIAEEALFLGARLILGVRDIRRGKALIQTLKEKKQDIEAELAEIDLRSLSSVYRLARELETVKIDYVIINSGVSNPMVREASDGIEEHFMVNFYAPYRLIRQMHRQDKEICFIVTGSVCYKQLKTNSEDLFLKEYQHTKDLYSHSKRILMQMMIILKRDYGYDIRLVHPGITYTELFYQRNRRGILKPFLPLVRRILISNERAALNILYALNTPTDWRVWIGPRGLFEIFGYPGIRRLKRELLNDMELETLNYKIEELDKIMEVKYGF